MIFFSVVTIVRNNAEGLQKTGQSLEKQICRDFEWIVVDGASTDKTCEVADHFKSAISKWVSESDSGIYDAMNKGLRLASGRYVNFLNAGDEFAEPASLSKARDALLALDPDVLYGQSLMIFGKTTISRQSRNPSYIWHGQPALHQATFFRRTEHLKYFYNTIYKICGDYDVITRMWADHLRFVSLPILVSANEFQSNSISGRNKLRLLIEAAKIQKTNLRQPTSLTLLSMGIRAGTSLVSKLIAFSTSGIKTPG
jgi:putative colanic acid biosynthesis glycosyltransferase